MPGSPNSERGNPSSCFADERVAPSACRTALEALQQDATHANKRDEAVAISSYIVLDGPAKKGAPWQDAPRNQLEGR